MKEKTPSRQGAINLDVKISPKDEFAAKGFRSDVVGGEIRRVPMEIEPARCNGVLHTDVVLRSHSQHLLKKKKMRRNLRVEEREN